jgi:transposase-like protein
MAHPKQTVDEAIRLRVQEQLGLDSISERLGVAKSTLSRWLKDYPLDDGIVFVRKQDGGRSSKKYRGDESDIHQIIKNQKLTTSQIGKVSEAAIALRLLIRGFNVFGSAYDGDRTDWLVEVPSTGKIWKIQVKTTHSQGYPRRDSLPTVDIQHKNRSKMGAQRYARGDFDFLVGYDLYTDTAYVWSWDEVEHLKRAITICPDAKERWDKLQE